MGFWGFGVLGFWGWGASFLKICILDIFGNISSHLSLDRCQKHPKKILTPRGVRGAN